eukprot:TRINITY_DN43144_c0_g1_i1.p1 TRINITY_DN43144_c0_g1~~TRINITY_DN43144_c0_g1_i1.p1  ORF type:complete len:184 (+),score=16.49 TRINITY_DN43144_c0_g1_i1:2-553(+)
MKSNSQLIINKLNKLTEKEKDDEQNMILELKIAGFINVEWMNSLNEDKYIICKHPSYDVGDKVKISLPDIDDNDELIDENDLVDNFTKGDVNSCGIDNPLNDAIPGKKRACKNCSCGLAEIEANEANGNAVKLNIDGSSVTPKPSCGSCYKGDAYRCASCPFLGKPSFNPGEESVILQLQDDI